MASFHPPHSVVVAYHALVFLAKHGGTASVIQIANAIVGSDSYLSKSLQRLTRTGIVLTVRGSSGGFRLGRPPSEITLKNLIEELDGELNPEKTCQTFFLDCDEQHCVMQPVIGVLTAVNSLLDSVTIEDSIRDRECEETVDDLPTV